MTRDMDSVKVRNAKGVFPSKRSPRLFYGSGLEPPVETRQEFGSRGCCVDVVRRELLLIRSGKCNGWVGDTAIFPAALGIMAP